MKGMSKLLLVSSPCPKMAPTYATLILGYLEEKLSNHIHIDTLLSKNYFRYLDDVLLIYNSKDTNITKIYWEYQQFRQLDRTYHR